MIKFYVYFLCTKVDVGGLRTYDQDGNLVSRS